MQGLYNVGVISLLQFFLDMDCGIDTNCVMPPHIVPAGKERIVVESSSIGFTMDHIKSIMGHRLINLIITDWWFQTFLIFSPI